MKFRGLLASVVVVFGVSGAATTSAQSAVFFDSRASFLSALGGMPTQTQDFSGFAAGTPLSGVAILPGLVAQSPFPTFEVFLGGGSDASMFGYTGGIRQASGGYYDLINTGGYTALGFDIVYWDPATAGANAVLSFASGGPLTRSLTATNATELDPVFFGFISSVAFTSLRLNEPFEIIGGNEEVGLDNFVGAVAAPVPEPGTVTLMTAGLLVAGAIARRQRRARDQPT